MTGRIWFLGWVIKHIPAFVLSYFALLWAGVDFYSDMGTALFFGVCIVFAFIQDKVVWFVMDRPWFDV